MSRCPPLPAARAVRRGSILILALWTLMTLGILALAVGAHVSASIRVAQYYREQTVADALARSGVELAVADIMRQPTNFAGDRYDNLPNHEARFRDNASLPGGTFSVWYTFHHDDTNRTNAGLVITNFGVLNERVRFNLDHHDEAASNRLARLLATLGEREALVSAMLSEYPAQKPIATNRWLRYGPYEAVPELLAVPGVSPELFDALEPLVTLHEFQRRYDEGGALARRAEDGQAYGGIAEGRAQAESGAAVTAVRRIAFVFDRATTNFLYWREH